MGKFISKSLNETREIAKTFLDNLMSKEDWATVIVLKGDLGSGKTTFVQAVAETLGLKEQITSPTFVIEKIYSLEDQKFKRLIHIDAYRLESGSDLESLGWEEVSKEKENIIFIEWPENVFDILPKDVKEIKFKFIDENSREIIYEKE